MSIPAHLLVLERPSLRPECLRRRPVAGQFAEPPSILAGYLAAHVPGVRNIRPEEVAAAVTFLASDDASGINCFYLQVEAALAQI